MTLHDLYDNRKWQCILVASYYFFSYIHNNISTSSSHSILNQIFYRDSKPQELSYPI